MACIFSLFWLLNDGLPYLCSWERKGEYEWLNRWVRRTTYWYQVNLVHMGTHDTPLIRDTPSTLVRASTLVLYITIKNSTWIIRQSKQTKTLSSHYTNEVTLANKNHLLLTMIRIFSSSDLVNFKATKAANPHARNAVPYVNTCAPIFTILSVMRTKIIIK